MLQIEQGRAQEKEAAVAARAKQVAEATLAQVQDQVRRDMESLERHLPSREDQTAEHALDMKYIRDRQATLSLIG